MRAVSTPERQLLVHDQGARDEVADHHHEGTAEDARRDEDAV